MQDRKTRGLTVRLDEHPFSFTLLSEMLSNPLIWVRRRGSPGTAADITASGRPCVCSSVVLSLRYQFADHSFLQTV